MFPPFTTCELQRDLYKSNTTAVIDLSILQLLIIRIVRIIFITKMIKLK